jgi:hypothetical protein
MTPRIARYVVAPLGTILVLGLLAFWVNKAIRHEAEALNARRVIVFLDSVIVEQHKDISARSKALASSERQLAESKQAALTASLNHSRTLRQRDAALTSWRSYLTDSITLRDTTAAGAACRANAAAVLVADSLALTSCETRVKAESTRAVRAEESLAKAKAETQSVRTLADVLARRDSVRRSQAPQLTPWQRVKVQAPAFGTGIGVGIAACALWCPVRR